MKTSDLVNNRVYMRDLVIKPNFNPPPISGEAADVELAHPELIKSIHEKETAKEVIAAYEAAHK